ncbi:hypothetical protein HAX54_034965, partial [Datura stramonium]|nr:hypothetical protein [Datura stramonium]
SLSSLPAMEESPSNAGDILQPDNSSPTQLSSNEGSIEPIHCIKLIQPTSTHPSTNDLTQHSYHIINGPTHRRSTRGKHPPS